MIILNQIAFHIIKRPHTLQYNRICNYVYGISWCTPDNKGGDGVRIPIYVNGVEVFEDQPDGECDYTDFKGSCKLDHVLEE